MEIVGRDNSFLFRGFPPDALLGRLPLTCICIRLGFSKINFINDREHVKRFQQAMGLLHPDTDYALVEDSADFEDPFVDLPGAAQPLWRLVNASRTWWVSLGSDFFSVETRRYEGQASFIDCATPLIEAVLAHFKPEEFQFLSLRGLVELTGATLPDVEAMVRPQAVGLFACGLGNHLWRSLIETLIQNPNTGDLIFLRSGMAPLRHACKTATISYADNQKFIIDVDIISKEIYISSSPNISLYINRQLKYLCSAFYWIMSDKFLSQHGDKAMEMQGRVALEPSLNRDVSDRNLKRDFLHKHIEDKIGDLLDTTDYDRKNKIIEKFNSERKHYDWDDYEYIKKVKAGLELTLLSGVSVREGLNGGDIDNIFDQIPAIFDAINNPVISDDVYEIRYLSELSWTDLGRLFRIDLGALRYWSDGGKAEASKAFWVRGVRDELRRFGSRNPGTIQAALTDISLGKSPLDLFAEGKFYEAVERFTNTIKRVEGLMEETDEGERSDGEPEFIRLLGGVI